MKGWLRAWVIDDVIYGHAAGWPGPSEPSLMNSRQLKRVRHENPDYLQHQWNLAAPRWREPSAVAGRGG